MASAPELQTLNTEMASLARAGVPLELGLSHLSLTLPRRLGALSGRIAERMQEGRSLIEALRQEGRSISPTYIAVVEAALAANRLPEALDALVEYGVAVRDMRRRVTLALLYPALVAVFAYALFYAFILQVAPVVLETLELAPSQLGGSIWILEKLSRTAKYWGPIAPFVFVALLWVASRVLAKVVRLNQDVAGGFWTGAWFPGVTGLYADLDRAQTTGLLGLLLEQGLPLPQSLRYAAGATRSSGLSAGFLHVATGIEHGQSLRSLVIEERQFPPLIAHLFVIGEREGRLAEALKQAAMVYRRRAVQRADWLRTVLPPVMVTVVGGGITLLYALTLFLPLRGLWMHLE